MTPSDRELLLQRYFDGLLSDSEQTRVESQLSESERITLAAWKHQRSALKNWADQQQRDGHELDFREVENRVKKSAAFVQGAAVSSVVSMGRSRLVMAWSSAAVVFLAVGVGWRAMQSGSDTEIDADSVETMVSAKTAETNAQVNDQALQLETIGDESQLTEVRHVDFGPREGVVYQVELDSGATIPVIWVNDDLEIE